ncbi:MAG TPA: nucleotidyl transferase AbiEii/AbiGii toxin family protein [bacterium]|mgnify:CR=1 FL=1|nr:nucleotidyl transferase AbiEii/AbiGii toxin family protein [bacterium]HPP29981.1 nucleotidyl transferase AbiEii/AbiGii toxin family protein [bacterium]
MKGYIKEILKVDAPLTENKNLLREYLQKYILFLIYKNNFYTEITFTGGSALRFLYQLRRFSEDLDFSLSKNACKYDFVIFLDTIKRELYLAGYEVEITYNIEKNVNNALIKFLNLLYEFKLSEIKGEKFTIKIEVDTLPPEGGREITSLYNSDFIFEIKHFDIPSLFAGKIHALLCRKFNRGRDYYDLLWYLTKFKNLEPNIDMLKNAVMQTCIKKINIKKFNWRELVREKIKTLDFTDIRKDIISLLEVPEEVKLITRENFLKLL